MEKIQKCKGKFKIFIFSLSNLDMTVVIRIEVDDDGGAFERFFEALFDSITHIMCLEKRDIFVEDEMKFYKHIFARATSLEEMIGINERWGGIDDIDDRFGVFLIERFVHEDVIGRDNNLARTENNIDRDNEWNNEIYHEESREFDDQYRDNNTHITE